MEYRRLGRCGLQVSELSLGSWVTFGKQVGEPEAMAMMALAYEEGINFFDNAEGYESGESEALMGAALDKLGWSRDSFIVSSKVFWGGDRPTQRGLSRKHVTEACHAALRRLRVDYLDLYFCHRPDVETPIEETVRAMHDLIAQGKVLYWGTSEWSAQQITEAWACARELRLTPPVVEQPEYNLFCRDKVESEFLPVYDLVGLGTTVWSPLASGWLTGKYNDGIPPDSRMALPGYEWLRERWESPEGLAKREKVRALQSLADELGLPLPHLALLWCLRNPRVSTVILGASRQSQLVDNIGALASKATLDAEALAAIESIVDNAPPAPERF